MSIENLLTVGLAAAILVAAAILRLLVLGAVRLVFKLSGRQVPAREIPAAAGHAARGPRRPLARPALNGLGSLGAGLIYVLATLGTWMRSAGTMIARGARAAYASAAPQVEAGTEKGLAAAGHKLRSAAVVAVASAQHLGRVIAHRVKEMADARATRKAATAPVEEPSDARVIVLDRDWDPLTDPLEDEPASNYR